MNGDITNNYYCQKHTFTSNSIFPLKCPKKDINIIPYQNWALSAHFPHFDLSCLQAGKDTITEATLSTNNKSE